MAGCQVVARQPELMNIPAQIELRRISQLLAFARNSRTHSEEQIAQVAASIREFGWTNPVLVGADNVIIAGHARVLAARQLGMTEVPVIVLPHLSELQRRALVIADNRLVERGGWNDEILRSELSELQAGDFDLEMVGFTDDELKTILAATEPAADESAAGDAEEEIPETPVKAVTRPGDIWLIGRHRLICGDCRDSGTVVRLLDGAQANVVITSPPYATQREYDPSSGFRPVPPEQYSDWYRAVAANVAAILADDGSYFLNIKAHADEGERNLYVMDLVLAHRRQWGWRFVDEFCWRKTDNGVPGGWGNRFKNAFEPIYHFCRQQAIKFRPQAVGHVSEDCFDYSPNNPKSTSGSGLLGTGLRGESASMPPKGSQAWGHMRRKLMDGRHEGIARPSNVIEVRSESTLGSHSAPYREYKMTELQGIMAGIGLPYELGTGDMSQVNYSSWRGGMLGFRNTVEAFRWLTLIPLFAMPVWRRFIDTLVLLGKIPQTVANDPKVGLRNVQWTAPRFESVDPVKDAEGVLKDVRMGRKTWFEAVLENGYDPTTQLEQIALFNKLVDKFEIILDTDPRNTTLRGQEQPAGTEERTPSRKAAAGKPKGQGLAALSEEELGMVKDLLVAGMSRAGGSFESPSRLYRG
jgi:hypothetical protein